MPARPAWFTLSSCQNGLKNEGLFCARIIITIGIYESHQALHLKVTLEGITSECGHAETMLSDKLSPLTRPFKSSSL